MLLYTSAPILYILTPKVLIAIAEQPQAASSLQAYGRSTSNLQLRLRLIVFLGKQNLVQLAHFIPLGTVLDMFAWCLSCAIHKVPFAYVSVI
jgi:hypothetical protein